MDHARANYVGFLDADDILLPGYFSSVMPLVRAAAADVVQFNLVRFKGRPSHRDPVVKCHTVPGGIYAIHTVRDDVFGRGKWFPCTRIFRKELLLNTRFPQRAVFYEDLITLPRIFLADFRIGLIDTPLVGYRDVEGSTTNLHKPEHMWTLLAYFSDLSDTEDCTAIRLLRLQLARTIVFFCLELKIKQPKVISQVLSWVGALRNKSELASHLDFADVLFLNAPYAYVAAEWIRQYVRRLGRGAGLTARKD